MAKSELSLAFATGGRRDLDLDTLLHPARAFGHPDEVVRDPGLTTEEKRAILASWASDLCAAESAPELWDPPAGRAVSFDEVMDALRRLDAEAAPAPRRRRDRARQALGAWRSDERSQDGEGGLGLQ
ncbi:MAG: hypothetical protein IRZ09_12905 [Variibacter sp.]|nr:hypothetical protein [Variibacter sp.]